MSAPHIQQVVVEVASAGEHIAIVEFSGLPGADGGGLPPGMTIALNDTDTALIVSVDGNPIGEIPLHEHTP